MSHSAYMFAAIFWMLIWAILFVYLRQQRSFMFWTGLLLGLSGPVSEYWFLRDYWHPGYLVEIVIGTWRFGPEDYIATFALAGICSGVFETIAIKQGFPPLPKFSFATGLRMMAWCTSGVVLMYVVSSLLGVGSIHALLIVITLTALLMLTPRPRLLLIASFLSIAAALGYWVFYWFVFMPLFPGVFEALWNLKETWGIMWLGVPIEEFLWVGATMLFAGPLIRRCYSPSYNV